MLLNGGVLAGIFTRHVKAEHDACNDCGTGRGRRATGGGGNGATLLADQTAQRRCRRWSAASAVGLLAACRGALSCRLARCPSPVARRPSPVVTRPLHDVTST